jgi:hypothetical protein
MIQNKAMLVRLSISKWEGRKYDKSASQEINSIKKADSDASRVNKRLVDKAFLEPINKAVNNFRTEHYKLTLPWTDEGARILPSEMYFDYMSKAREMRLNVEEIIEERLLSYDQEIQASKKRLGGLYSPLEYPSKEEIRKKFGVSLHVYPIPSGEDFRVSLSASEEKEIKNDIEESVKTATEQAMKSLWKKLYDSVNKVVERLSDPENKFKDSLINNLIELCEILPRLNITDDSNLENMRREVETRLCAYLPDALRSNTAERERAFKEAKNIMENMSGYLSEIDN